VVILDGGIATELEQRGADLNDPLWSAKVLVEAPQLLEQVNHDYFAAGADLGVSATYQATFEGFARRGIDRRAAADLLRFSVQLVRDARDRFWNEPANREGRSFPLVAASVGCYGAFLADGSEYRGDYGLSVRRLAEFHRPRLDVLADSGADLLTFETIPCAHEAEAIIRLLEDYPHIGVLISFSARDETSVCHGEPFSVCVDLTNDAPSCLAVGVNCTPPRYVTALLRSVRDATARPLMAYPNSGESWDAAQHRWIAGPDAIDFTAAAQEWYDSGARLIGGCCRTTPETIHGIARAMRRPGPLGTQR
jgi:homocysteine S-methyltransferase